MSWEATASGQVESRSRLAAWRRRWERRLVRFAAPEVVGGGLIVVGWSLLAGLGLGLLPVLTVLVVASLWLHLAAVETGSHMLLWIATGWLLILVAIAGEVTLGGVGPLSYAVASVTVLGHNELVRATYARRRAAQVDDRVRVASGVGVALAGLVAVIGIGVAQPLASSGGRGWVWMPAAALVLVGLAAMLTLVPARNAPRPQRQRWQPGERIPPQPISSDETTTDGAGPPGRD